jgi:cytosine/adenosine deaminase-related metal-dependent hydrolase
MVVPGADRHLRAGLLRSPRRRRRCGGLSWQVHAAQSVVEFHEITRRHGVTPIGLARSMGLLNDRAIIGHGIFLDDHPTTPWHTRSDLDRLAETGTTVAHCPTVFARRGITMKNFGRYKRRGREHGPGDGHLSPQHARRDPARGLPRAHPGDGSRAA